MADLERSLVVTQSNRVDGKAGKLIDQGNEGLEVFFDADVESVTVLEVDRHLDLLAIGFGEEEDPCR